LLFLVILFVIIGCQSADKGLLAEKGTGDAGFDTQLKINKDALFKGSSERVRLDAATVMMFSEDRLARGILLEALGQSQSVPARVAVCKALIRARTEQRTIRAKEEFIKSLFNILKTETDQSAKLSAESLLIFDYEQISEQLEGIADDVSLPAQARLNAIYALRLQPDMKAIFKLIELLDDSENIVAAEAEKALRFLGTPIGKDAKARKQIRSELQQKGRDEFFRDLLIRQEAQMRGLQTERDFWQRRYLGALEKIMAGINDDSGRGEFLLEHLADPQPVVKLWVLDKVSQWRMGTTSKLPAELGLALVQLISDRDRKVRLNAARLLSLMMEVDSAKKLYEQLKIEQDDEVKTELFVALGGVCYYAFLPNSGVNVSPGIRKFTLELAAEYVASQDAKKAQRGLEVIKRLLEQDGLAGSEVDKYFDLLVAK